MISDNHLVGDSIQKNILSRGVAPAGSVGGDAPYKPGGLGERSLLQTCGLGWGSFLSIILDFITSERRFFLNAYMMEIPDDSTLSKSARPSGFCEHYISVTLRVTEI